MFPHSSPVSVLKPRFMAVEEEEEEMRERTEEMVFSIDPILPGS